MALNFNSNVKEVKEVMYKVVIEGHEWTLNEVNTQRIIDILNGMSSQVSASTPAPKDKPFNLPAEPASPKPINGRKIWQENFVDVVDEGGVYRVYMSVPIPGKKGQYIRDRIKEEFKSFGAKWTGDIQKNICHWTFGSKEQADNYIAARKKAAKERA